MPISEQEIKHIAELSRIRLTSKDIVCYQKDLAEILAYVDKLKKLETKAKPLNKNRDLKNVFRDDNGEEWVVNYEVKKLLEDAPENIKEFIKVPVIFKKNEL